MFAYAPSTPAPDLCCPTCRGALSVGPADVHCKVCDRSWPLRQGIASFASGGEQCPEETPAPFATALQHAGEDDWEEAFHRQFPREDPAGYWHIYDPPCADWFHLGGVDARRLAVVLGVGTGAAPMRLARLFERVIAVDWQWERAEFARRLLAHEGLPNVTVIHADLNALPLPPAQADLVVLVGELERAAFRGEQGDAEAAQRALLAEAFNLLRPGGSLCLGASNRFAVAHLLGRPDHGRPPWAGVLPRRLGRLYGALRREGARHALSHSPAGYRRLLTGAGFTDVRSYAAFPSHYHPRVLVPRSDPARLAWLARLSLARRGRRLGAGARLVHWLASSRAAAVAGSLVCGSLITWARRPPGATGAGAATAPQVSLSQGLRERLFAEWSQLGLRGAPRALSIVQLSGNWDRGGKVNWFIFPYGSREPAVVAKVARTPADADRMDNEYGMLGWLRSQRPSVSEHIPRPLARWEISGHLVTLQQYAPWPPLTKQVVGKRPEAAVLYALRTALPFLTELALAGREECPSGAGNPYLARLIAESRRAAAGGHYQAATRELLVGLADLAAEAAGLSFTVPHQGDVSAADILFAGPREFHVLDWEWSARQGVPLIDVVSLALSSASRHDAKTVRHTIRALAMLPVTPGKEQAELDALVDGYCATLGLRRDWRRALVAAALLNAMLRTPECRISHLIISLPDEADELIVAARALLAGERRPEEAQELRSFVLMQRVGR